MEMAEKVTRQALTLRTTANVKRFMSEQLEAMAPGFGRRVLARRAVTPVDLEAFDPNLVGGDLGGGSNHWRNLMVLRNPIL